MDGGAQTEGIVVSVTGVSAHTLEFWSVDTASNVETPHNSANFAITAPPDTTPPTTTSDAVASYSGAATIHMTATDNPGGSGVAHTYYRLDGGTQTEGVSCGTSVAGPHTLEFWSSDVAGNPETPHHTAAFTVTATTQATSITIKTAATSTTVGKIVTLSGAVTPMGMIGQNIVAYVMKPGSARWTYSSNRTTYALNGAAAWQYKYFFKPGMAKGTYKFKAVVPAWPGYLTSTSPTTVSIKVR